MATKSIEGIWGLEQLDRTGLATWKIVLIVMASGGVLAAILMLVSNTMPPSGVFSDSERRTAGLMTVAISLAIMVTFHFVLSRGVEEDLKALISLDESISHFREKLGLDRLTTILCVVPNTVFLSLMVPLIISFDRPSAGLAQTLSDMLATWSGIMVIIGMTINGLLGGLLISSIISHLRCLTHVARNIKIDLSRLNILSALTNSAVRDFLMCTLLITIFPLAGLLASENSHNTFHYSFLIASILSTPYILVYLYPVWVAKNRVAERKTAELEFVAKALDGNKEAASNISMQGMGAPTTTADLLTYLMFLESRWEWPVAAHVQKIVLFGLVAPLTWVLAAIIENLLY